MRLGQFRRARRSQDVSSREQHSSTEQGTSSASADPPVVPGNSRKGDVTSAGASADDGQDEELKHVVADEQRCLRRILDHVEEKRQAPRARKQIDYDTQLLQLRDEIAASRMEDVPPLLEQMERLQGIAARQRELTEGFVDPRSPYFGRMVLEENGRKREVLIGRSTYLDAKAGVRIVDWRDAPVSRLYYRYAEGDDYEEVFGDREVEGEVLVRRSLTIIESELRRILSPQGTFLKPEKGDWKRGGASLKLSGGQGTAPRADQHMAGPKKLGIGDDAELTEDKHLKEITALIDPRQFELITRPDSGLVVVQGGAGSGKTTIGLHRLAYLAFQDARRFRADRMLVVVFNDALARYIGHVLPALDVHGVAVRTYEEWSRRLRQQMLPEFPKRYSEETPPLVTRMKKNPMMLQLIARYADECAADIEVQLKKAAGGHDELRDAVAAAWQATGGKPLAHRAHGIRRWVERNGTRLSPRERHSMARVVDQALYRATDLLTAWVDILTDRKRIDEVFAGRPALALSERELERAVAWCRQRCSAVLQEQDQRDDAKDRERESEDDYAAIDGKELEEQATLDVEDDTLLLALWQRLRGPLRRGGSKDALVYEHVLVDEAQDLSPVELSIVMGCVSKAQSVTLSGDVAQRLHMHNGFEGWDDTLAELGLNHVEIEPLQVSYRSTAQIISFARDVLAHLAPELMPEAIREGAPVELFRFADSGEAVGFLAEALKDLIDNEPRASVAVIARHPEQADAFYQGLYRAETPKVRRIAHQDFPFKPGIDVTDVRQVKGLEFDYVIMVEVSEATYPPDDEARHLLHIAATRAAHQLWILTSGKPSSALPRELRERGY
jgi:DNA helicase-2/ATP-dependent DNA helicase PcrA